YPSHTTSDVSYFAAHILLLKGVTKLDPWAGPGNEKAWRRDNGSRQTALLPKPEKLKINWRALSHNCRAHPPARDNAHGPDDVLRDAAYPTRVQATQSNRTTSYQVRTEPAPYTAGHPAWRLARHLAAPSN